MTAVRAFRFNFNPICRVDRTPEPPHHEGRVFARGAVMTGLTHRQSEILNIARAFGRVMVEDLARRFEVSAQTIRKDLNDLCDHRSLTRIHGGAIIASGVENLAYEARRFVAVEEKKAIGAAAAALIPNGCSPFINIGTTTEDSGIGKIGPSPWQTTAHGHRGICQTRKLAGR